MSRQVNEAIRWLFSDETGFIRVQFKILHFPKDNCGLRYITEAYCLMIQLIYRLHSINCRMVKERGATGETRTVHTSVLA
jgi:hypothetical protein